MVGKKNKEQQAASVDSSAIETPSSPKRRARFPEGGRRIVVTYSKEGLKELMKLGIDLETGSPKETLEFANEFLIAGAKRLAREGRAVTKESLMELIGGEHV